MRQYIYAFCYQPDAGFAWVGAFRTKDKQKAYSFAKACGVPASEVKRFPAYDHKSLVLDAFTWEDQSVAAKGVY